MSDLRGDGAGAGAAIGPATAGIRRPGALDRARVDALCHGDGMLLRALAVSFVEAASRALREANSAIDAGDPKRLAAAGHLLRGICLTMGAEPLARIAGELEQLAAIFEFPSARACLALSRDAWNDLRRELDALTPALDWTDPFAA